MSCSFLSSHREGSNPGTMAATSLRSLSVGNSVMNETPRLSLEKPAPIGRDVETQRAHEAHSGDSDAGNHGGRFPGLKRVHLEYQIAAIVSPRGSWLPHQKHCRAGRHRRDGTDHRRAREKVVKVRRGQATNLLTHIGSIEGDHDLVAGGGHRKSNGFRAGRERRSSTPPESSVFCANHCKLRKADP